MHTSRILEIHAYLVIGHHIGNGELIATLLPVNNPHLFFIFAGSFLLEFQFQLGTSPLIILLLLNSSEEHQFLLLLSLFRCLFNISSRDWIVGLKLLSSI